MKTIQFVILEDDADFRNALITELNATEGCKVIGASDNVVDGYNEIIRLRPEALILDIELFGGTAFDVVRMLKANDHEIPPVVMITANVKFEAASEAIDVCEGALIKLIGKPFWQNWISEFPDIKASILSRIQKKELEDEEGGLKLSEARDVLFIRSSQMTHRITVADILYLEVDGEGQTNIIMQDQRRIRVRKTLSVLLNLLPTHILRVNRFNAINSNKLLHINHEDDTLMLDGHAKPLTIGEKYKDKLRELFA